MPGLLGKKIGMTSIYSENGELIPVTVVEAVPNVIIGMRTSEKDGYSSLQLGFGEKKEKRVNKPLMGQFQKAGVKPVRVVKEFKNFDVSAYKTGETIGADIFAEGDKVKVTGYSKGKGFQGVMRRHGFGGVGTQTHGQHNRLRAPGSIGQSSDPSKVFKGTRMAGRTGGVRKTVAGLKIIKVEAEKNLLFIKGALPGSVNSVVEINK